MNPELTEFDLQNAEQCAEWDRFVESAPSATVYQGSPWLLALRQGLGHDVRAYAVGQPGQWTAGAVVRRASRVGIAVARKPWATAYTLFHAETAAPNPSDLMDALAKRYLHVRLVLRAQASTPQASDGWNPLQSATPLLGPAQPDALWDSFDRHARQRVRKAETAKVKAGETHDTGLFFDLYRQTYLRQGIDMPLSRTAITATFDAAIHSGVARLYAAHVEDRPAAALFVGFDHRRLYFMLAASHTELRKTDAVTYLWWHVMQQHPGREIDLVGHGVAALDRFKASFSPRYVPVFEFSRYRPGLTGILLRTAENARQALAKRSPERTGA